MTLLFLSGAVIIPNTYSGTQTIAPASPRTPGIPSYPGIASAEKQPTSGGKVKRNTIVDISSSASTIANTRDVDDGGTWSEHDLAIEIDKLIFEINS